jgi:hypothetical protein
LGVRTRGVLGSNSPALPPSKPDEAESSPELHPLREALQRALVRKEEATGIREGLEAEVR